MSRKTEAGDLAHMRAALGLARRSLGAAWPNPAVGCVLVRPAAAGGPQVGRVVGRGWTQSGGRPHGETEALARAGAAAAGATAYISLEPCNHHGKTPPCTDALIAAGIKRAVITLEDPDPRVSGAGIAQLRSAGIETVVGVCTEEGRELNAGFFLRLAEGRPLVTLKLATTLDGRIATRAGESRWITGEVSRAWAHALRASHDAIMVGLGTVEADDPRLTCRLPGLEQRSPIRVVVDSRLRLSLKSHLVTGARQTPTWVITGDGARAARKKALAAAGVEVIAVAAGAEGRPDPRAALLALGDRGLTRVLVEGGSRLAASLLAARLVDRIVWARAPSLIGGDGVPAVEAFGVERLTEAMGFRRLAVRRSGPDLLETYRREP